MAVEMIILNVRPRGKPIRKLPKEISLPLNTTGHELYNALAQQSGYSFHRLRVTRGSNGSLISNGEETVYDMGLRNQSVVHVKDLGPQIAWRTVFLIEYLGPLIIPPLVLYLLRPYVYFNIGKPLSEPSSSQVLVCALLVIHYTKRELETLFIHRFSLATMPARNIVKNCIHYWILGGMNVAYWVFHPNSLTATGEPNVVLVYLGLALFIFGEIANLNTHLVLRGLRRAGSIERGIPKGFGFSLVTCPNYMFEVIAWLGVSLVSGLNWSVILFAIVGLIQMMSWAAKKERRYRREFGDSYKRKRFVMIPGIF